jgi:CRP-like cAMP-binding protein
MLKQIVRQFVAYKARVDNLEYKFARERVAYQLLFLARRFGVAEDGVVSMNRFSQEEIGSATNVSREGVSRELKRFERLKYIRYVPGKLLLDPDRLRSELAPKDAPLFIDDL